MPRSLLAALGIVWVAVFLGGCGNPNKHGAEPKVAVTPAATEPTTPEADSPEPTQACPPCPDDAPPPAAAAVPAQTEPLVKARRGEADKVAVFDPRSGLRLIGARREEGMTRVTVAWPPLDDKLYTGWQIEVAEQAEGPFLKRAEGETGADRPGVASFTLGKPVSFARLISIARKSGKKTAGGAIRLLAVADLEYDAGRRTVPYAPDHSARVRALVRFPAGIEALEGHIPLALITHGNAGNCRDAQGVDHCEQSMILEDRCPEGKTPTPSAEGFLWLADSLAARGYVVAVIDANTVTAPTCRSWSKGGRR